MERCYHILRYLASRYKTNVKKFKGYVLVAAHKHQHESGVFDNSLLFIRQFAEEAA